MTYNLIQLYCLQVSENSRHKKPEQENVHGIYGLARSGHERARGLCGMADQVLGLQTYRKGRGWLQCSSFSIQVSVDYVENLDCNFHFSSLKKNTLLEYSIYIKKFIEKKTYTYIFEVHQIILYLHLPAVYITFLVIVWLQKNSQTIDLLNFYSDTFSL